MGKADLGSIKKEKTIRSFTVYFSDIDCSMFIVAVKNGSSVEYSRAFPYSESTKKQQMKTARNAFNDVMHELREKDSLEAFES